MKISYLGHSSFRLVSDKGTSILTDPYGDVGLVFPHVTADAVTVSHSHFDHCNVRAVEGNPSVFQTTESVSFRDIKFSAIERSHDEVQGKKRGKNLVFLYEIDGLLVCHMGDIGEPFSEELSDRLKGIDLLLIPVGGNYTIDANEAKNYVEGLRPKIVIPMHYKVSGLTVDISSVEGFLSLFDGVTTARGEMEITNELLSGERKILYLERA